MKISTEHMKGDYPVIFIYANKDFDKVLKVSEIMQDYGYNLAHQDDSDCYVMLSHMEMSATIQTMRSDYMDAKKGAC